MSTLQKAIEENTAAVIALTAALRGQDALRAPDTATVTITTVPVKEDTPPEAPATVEAPVDPLSYEKDVKPWAIKLAAKDKAAFLAILAKHQASKGSELAPRVLAAALADIKGALSV